MRAILPLFSLALFACGSETPGESFGEEPLSCEHDPHSWYDNPFASVLVGDGGVFDLDPIGDSVVARVGAYDVETGDYEYLSTYAEEHPYVTSWGEGYGTIYDNGDLDLITKVVVEDVLGDSWAEQVRTKRSGCSGTVKRTELDLDAPVDSLPDEWADSVEWTVTIESDELVNYHAELDEEYGLYVSDFDMSPDYASQGSFDYASGAYVGTTTMLWDGSGSSSWEQYGATFGQDSDFIGEDELFIDGSRHTVYEVYNAGSTSLQAEVDLLWLYDGSATGSYVIYQSGSTITCDVTITDDGDCSMYCPGYGTYDC